MSPTLARRVPLLSLLALIAGCDIAGCDQEPPAPSGELDRLGDIVLVTPDPEDGEGRSFVVVTNPEVRQLRVFDVLERRFVRAPNVFFPLSARTGPATRRLDVPPVNQRFVYALDGAFDLLQVVDMALTVEVDEDTVAPAFTTAAVFATGRAPSDVTVWSSGVVGEPALAFVTLPQISAVQVLALDVENQTVVDEALIDLGEGAHPNRAAVDPTGDAVVITDAALDSVAILRILPFDDDAATPLAELDRRIDVGGPSNDVAIGQVDPGDGLAPLALVSLRTEPVLAAVRLFRPGFREDRYELLGRVGLPDFATALYVPNQDREAPKACCPLLSLEQVNPDPPTFAWGSATTANGFLYYVGFDVPRRGGGSLVRLLDFGTPTPGPRNELTSDLIWFPAEGGDARRPVLALAPIDEYGDPPFFPFLDEDLQIEMVFEGSPAGTSDRRAELVSTGDGFALEVVPADVAFEERDVRAGDEIVVDTSDRGGSCPESVTMIVEGVTGDTVSVSGIDATEAACVSQGGEVRFTLFAVGDFVVSTTTEGYQGRLPIEPTPTSLEVTGFVITATQSAAGEPLRGSRFRIGVTQGLDPVRIHLARLPDFRGGGFGAAALLPQGMAGGSVRIRDIQGNAQETTRLFIATGTGTLLVMEEATVNIDAVQPFN